MTEDELICLAFWLDSQMDSIATNPHFIDTVKRVVEADGVADRDAQATLFVVRNLMSVAERLVEVAESLCEEYEGESDGS